jgi:hypothetical protein
MKSRFYLRPDITILDRNYTRRNNQLSPLRE